MSKKRRNHSPEFKSCTAIATGDNSSERLSDSVRFLRNTSLKESLICNALCTASPSNTKSAIRGNDSIEILGRNLRVSEIIYDPLDTSTK